MEAIWIISGLQANRSYDYISSSLYFKSTENTIELAFLVDNVISFLRNIEYYIHLTDVANLLVKDDPDHY